MHFPGSRKQRSHDAAVGGNALAANTLPDTVVSGVVEAIGHFARFEVPTLAGVHEILPSLNNALKTHFVIKLEGSDEIHTLQSERWTEILALTSKGDRIAFVVSATGAHRILSLENHTLWPQQAKG